MQPGLKFAVVYLAFWTHLYISFHTTYFYFNIWKIPYGKITLKNNYKYLCYILYNFHFTLHFT